MLLPADPHAHLHAQLDTWRLECILRSTCKKCHVQLPCLSACLASRCATWRVCCCTCRVCRADDEHACAVPSAWRVDGVHTWQAEQAAGHRELWAWGADQFGDVRQVDARWSESAGTSWRAMRGSDTGARGVAGRVNLESCLHLQHGIDLKQVVSSCTAGHSLLVLAWQLPWELERVLWIGLLKCQDSCPLARLPLDGPRTCFVLSKIIEMVSSPT